MITSSLKFLLLNFLLTTSYICFSQNETILSGSIEGLDAGSKITLSSTAANERLDSITVTTDSFQFKLNPEEGDIYFIGFTVNSQSFVQPVYLQDGSNINLKMTKDFGTINFEGSRLADEQNDFMKGLLPIYKKEKFINNEIQESKEPGHIKQLKIDSEQVNQSEQNYYKNWVSYHKNSPFSTAVIYLYMQQSGAKDLKTCTIIYLSRLKKIII